MSRRFPLLAALALLVAALIAVALALGPRTGPPRENSPEVRFVREMTQHHAQAVDMATRIRDRSQDRTLRSVALDILLSQQEQIGQMRGWLTLWGLPWGGAGMTAEHARMMGMAAPADLSRLDTLPVKDAERLFLQLMIRHHQGALSMVKPALAPGIRPEVRTLARQIQATQTGEIRLMGQMLAERGAKPLPAPAAASDHAGMEGMEGMDMGSGSEHQH
ncbi:DUF305 domain-containing protein [Deinococcus metallilatus]|uniref:DUF305 domain-containing protein n=1 Tax=Deinococcus metallilatus TaxID=1211322 RepID=A0AAJ5JY67_9DEIO|nr:DUF305 domain-containing protein [Deinococcus metallilatus]MBB5295917.1 uncharacterized protein (DUF305 family) [Deinococcus metallilatus]QBY08249.1 DUF305 domain-containing protein [Deinococcus metallilatus]RXJ11980.1 DUF305 domain-containing protein [Deinococcus metallilatus]TLK25788.1 DUF305 domain-containing protein [Deinococcus metallilatus]GMA14549.1 DUF305 domain-containing protein [Deinococcus metallilatus]